MDMQLMLKFLKKQLFLHKLEVCTITRSGLIINTSCKKVFYYIEVYFQISPLCFFFFFWYFLLPTQDVGLFHVSMCSSIYCGIWNHLFPVCCLISSNCLLCDLPMVRFIFHGRHCVSLVVHFSHFSNGFLYWLSDILVYLWVFFSLLYLSSLIFILTRLSVGRIFYSNSFRYLLFSVWVLRRLVIWFLWSLFVSKWFSTEILIQIVSIVCTVRTFPCPLSLFEWLKKKCSNSVHLLYLRIY